MTQLIAPTICTNGTSRDEIEGNLEAAGSALQAALKALNATAPNARDYGDSFAVAKAQHEARERKVLEVLRQMVVIYDEVTGIDTTIDPSDAAPEP